MKFVLHVGMHKTGTSSIQNTFVRVKSDQFTYLPGAGANHSGWFIQQFHDEEKLESYHGFRALGLSQSLLLEQRRRSFTALDDFIARTKPETLIISAEDMATAGLEGANQRMADYINSHGAGAQIIGYVRPPMSFATSIYQQALKGQIKPEFRFDNRMPNYRARLQRYDDLYGRDRVSLRKFHPASLYRGDVVLDFAKQVSFDLAPDKIVRSNESLSREAAAFLYVQRRFGRGFAAGFQEALRQNMNFISLLSRVGGTKLTFATALMEPLLFARRKDIEWAEARLGESLTEDMKDDPAAIRSEDDFIETAMDQRSALHEVTEGRYPLLSAETPGALAAILDDIYAGLGTT